MTKNSTRKVSENLLRKKVVKKVCIKTFCFLPRAHIESAPEGLIDSGDDDESGEGDDDADDGVFHIALGGFRHLFIPSRQKILQTGNNESDDSDDADKSQEPIHQFHQEVTDRLRR